MDDEVDPDRDPDEEARYRSLTDDLRVLASDAMAVASAEVDLQKARAGYAVGRIKAIALFGALAAVLVLFSLVALTVGLVIALTPELGAIGATFAVFGGLVAIGAACAMLAVGKWKRMVSALSNPDAP